MIEISVDGWGRVYVLRDGRGPHQVLNPDGTSHEEFTAPGAQVVYSEDDTAYRGSLAYEAGVAAAEESFRQKRIAAQEKAAATRAANRRAS